VSSFTKSTLSPSELFQRYEGNPILKAEDLPYPAHTVFNPGATKLGDETILLCRVEDRKGFSHLTVARSQNGINNWEIDSEPTLSNSDEYEEERWGLEDPRVVQLEEPQEYAITYTSFSPGGPLVSLATTSDFESFNRHGRLVPPEDKDAALFPRKFDGRYLLIHRPIARGEANIWLSASPDLTYWGEHKILLPKRGGWWDSTRVGLGTQPIETEKGWLIIYHGARSTASGSLYRVGLALLDLETPSKVISRSDEWVFGPKKDYEFIGDVPGVVFPCGAVFEEDSKELRIYYGAADTSIGVAFANLDKLLYFLQS